MYFITVIKLFVDFNFGEGYYQAAVETSAHIKWFPQDQSQIGSATLHQNSNFSHLNLTSGESLNA